MKNKENYKNNEFDKLYTTSLLVVIVSTTLVTIVHQVLKYFF